MPEPNPTSRPWTPALAVACLVCFFAHGCASQKPATAVTPVERRIDAVQGRVLVTPVRPVGDGEPGPDLDVKLSDGRRLEAGLYWIGVSVDPEAAGSWLPDPGRWSVTPAGLPRPPGTVGAWHAVVSLPHDCIGQTIWFGRSRVQPNWLPDPSLALREILSRTGTAERPWELPVSAELLENETLRELASPEARSPVRRWRWRLLNDGLAPPPEPSRDGLVGLRAAPNGFADPVLEALARHTESRWRSALALLWRDDPALAERVKQRIALVVDHGSHAVPAWATDQGELGALLDDLTDMSVPPQTRAQRARRFLFEAPAMTARVVDDHGGRDARGRPLPTLELVNLGELPTLRWVRGDAGTGTPEPETIEASSAALSVSAPAAPNPRSPGRGTLLANVGQESRTLAAAVEITPARPPGLAVGPFRYDLTLDQWLAGADGARPIEEWFASGLLFKADRAVDAWTLMLECRRPAHGAGESLRRPPESVRVWFGTRGYSTVSARIFETGPATAGSSIEDRGDRWVTFIDVPAEAIDERGTLRLGVERIDGLGRRSAWPRPMTPWQDEPGRAAIDTNAWSGADRAADDSADATAGS